jgi:hypothetical protein
MNLKSGVSQLLRTADAFYILGQVTTVGLADATHFFNTNITLGMVLTIKIQQ